MHQIEDENNRNIVHDNYGKAVTVDDKRRTRCDDIELFAGISEPQQAATEMRVGRR